MAELNKFVVLFTLIWAASAQIQGSYSGKKVKLYVNYSNRCKTSRQFVSEQLPALMSSPLSKLVDLELIPYGKTVMTTYDNGTYDFTCQFGPSECEEFKTHVCALAQLPQSKALEFISCIMNGRTPAPDAQVKCSKETNTPLKAIKACANSPESEKLMVTNAEKTNALQPKIFVVPWILINGVLDLDQRENAIEDLKKEICNVVGESTCRKAGQECGGGFSDPCPY